MINTGKILQEMMGVLLLLDGRQMILKVADYADNYVLKMNQAVSMNIL